MNDFTYDIHREKAVDNFSAVDGTVRFYGFVQSALLRTKAQNVLDFGAGRGGGLVDGTSEYKRHLMDLRGFGAKVTACDIDDAVLEHPASHEQVLITPDKTLPFDDESFDVVVCDMTFEHIDNADFVARELARITRKGGFICARTPNRYGYVKLFSSLTPNRMHKSFLRSVQPRRREFDVFPTKYLMNSPKQISRLFRDFTVHFYYDNADPSYYFGSKVFYEALLVLHKFLPRKLATSVCFFIEKTART